MRLHLRTAWRSLGRNPVFTAVAIAVLGLGIGANSAIFTLVNAVLFRPSQVQEPGELVDIYSSEDDSEFSTSSYPDYLDLRDRSTQFAGVLHYRLNTLLLTGDGGSQQLWTEIVSGNYFHVLGVPPAVGRLFEADRDDIRGAPLAVVLSHRFWQRQFGGDPGAVGRTLRLNGQAFAIVGVAAPEFTGMVRGIVPAIWVTVASTERTNGHAGVILDRGNRGGWNKARLRPGATLARAATELTTISRDLAAAWPTTNAGLRFTLVPSSTVLVHPSVDGMLTAGGVVLLVVPGLVLLIACTNLVTLVLARAEGRRREVAVRLALGATRGQLVRQLLTEQMVLAVMGGAVGLALSAWLVQLLMAFRPPLPIPPSLDLSLDARVVGFTFLLTALAGLGIGLAPALRGSRVDLVADLRDGVAGGLRGNRVRRLLVAGQLALSMLLLVAAGLLVRGIGSAATIDRGFDGAHTAVVGFDLGQSGVDAARGDAFYRRLEERTRQLPGVEAVAWTHELPLSLNYQSAEIVAEGQRRSATAEGWPMAVTWVSPEYFDAIGTPLRRGRVFAESDRPASPRVAIVSETAAARLWPGSDPLGRRILRQGSPEVFEVIGVAADSKVMTLGEEPRPKVYFATTQTYRSDLYLLARVAGDPTMLLPRLRDLVDSIDPAISFNDLTTVSAQVTIALFPVRFTAGLLSVLGVAGMLIAMIGLYGVIAEGVARRSRELGIRMALGAEGSRVAGMVLREALVLAGLGAAAGLVLALLATRILTAWLYGISATDPVTFLIVPAGFAVVASLAAWLPARRATRVDPVVALRAE